MQPVLPQPLPLLLTGLRCEGPGSAQGHSGFFPPFLTSRTSIETLFESGKQVCASQLTQFKKAKQQLLRKPHHSFATFPLSQPLANPSAQLAGPWVGTCSGRCWQDTGMCRVSRAAQFTESCCPLGLCWWDLLGDRLGTPCSVPTHGRSSFVMLSQRSKRKSRASPSASPRPQQAWLCVRLFNCAQRRIEARSPLLELPQKEGGKVWSSDRASNEGFSTSQQAE